MRLRAPIAENKERAPRLLADIANQGIHELVSMTNEFAWQLEVDGTWYVCDGPQGAVFENSYAVPGGVLLDVLPGRPWTNLPVMLDSRWRTAHSNELGTAKFGGSGYWVPDNLPEPLKLSPGRHTVRLAVVASPRVAHGGGPFLATSKTVEIYAPTNIPAPRAEQRELANAGAPTPVRGKLVDDETGETKRPVMPRHG